MRRIDLMIGIVLGLVLGIVALILYIFIFSNESIDAPSIDQGSAPARQAAEAPQ